MDSYSDFNFKKIVKDNRYYEISETLREIFISIGDDIHPSSEIDISFNLGYMDGRNLSNLPFKSWDILGSHSIYGSGEYKNGIDYYFSMVFGFIDLNSDGGYGDVECVLKVKDELLKYLDSFFNFEIKCHKSYEINSGWSDFIEHPEIINLTFNYISPKG